MKIYATHIWSSINAEPLVPGCGKPGTLDKSRALSSIHLHLHADVCSQRMYSTDMKFFHGFKIAPDGDEVKKSVWREVGLQHREDSISSS